VTAENVQSTVNSIQVGDVSQVAQIFGNKIARYSEHMNSENESDPSWIKKATDCLSKAYPVGIILLDLISFAAEVLLSSAIAAYAILLGCSIPTFDNGSQCCTNHS
jgi:hypothetical protein